MGQASHIYSAAPNGPRGRGGLTDAQLADVSNGVWTCELHGKEIDNNGGRGFQVGLLKEWKRLHEAKMERASTGKPIHQWIERLSLLRTPLFSPKSTMYLGNVTVLSGPNSSGKTAICEWLAGFRDVATLKRWVGHKSRQPINLELAFTHIQAYLLELEVLPGEHAQISLDGVREPLTPAILDFVYLSRRYLDQSAGDDLSSLAKMFAVSPETITSLAKKICAKGDKRFLDLNFEVSANEDDDEQADEPRRQLIVETHSPGERYPLESFGGGLETELLLAFAVELAKLKSRHHPTLLILQASGWGFDEEQFRDIADRINECVGVCQVLVVEPSIRIDPELSAAREWVRYTLVPSTQGGHRAAVVAG
ncbi:hypothetical protein [Rhizobium laguerreae]|uniref:hypothetical protein n=1 Tax=Rhizobium laguerreae TaxID=1076926 RepID=UPI001C91F01F|nr:hypothetical protein [Rhizobium laguerreae]MBY3116697.1 hypothetical protein [Rhizobium laguerreae]